MLVPNCLTEGFTPGSCDWSHIIVRPARTKNELCICCEKRQSNVTGDMGIAQHKVGLDL